MIDHTFVMTDLSISEGFFMEKIMEHHLSYVDQVLLFKKKGITGIDQNSIKFEKQVNTLKIIGYYKLKQYSYAFWDHDNNQYMGISFDELVKRYYRDQRLKQEIFQAIGDIETALNNEISYILGKTDPYLYLDFEKWCQNSGRNKYLGTVKRRGRIMGVKVDKYKIKNEELAFLSQLQHQVKKSNYIDVQKFERTDRTRIFPTVWLMVNTLSFGQSIYLAKLMLPDNRKEISQKLFHLDIKSLIQSLELLNLIRNICCHNGDLVDISLKTMPKVATKYRKYLNMDNGNYPHRLAIVIISLLDLMYSLNKKYDFKYLKKTLNSLCKDTGRTQNYLAKRMGFKDKNSINALIESYKDKRAITFYPDGSYIYR